MKIISDEKKAFLLLIIINYKIVSKVIKNEENEEKNEQHR